MEKQVYMGDSWTVNLTPSQDKMRFNQIDHELAKIHDEMATLPMMSSEPLDLSQYMPKDLSEVDERLRDKPIEFPLIRTYGVDTGPNWGGDAFTHDPVVSPSVDFYAQSTGRTELNHLHHKWIEALRNNRLEQAIQPVLDSLLRFSRQ